MVQLRLVDFVVRAQRLAVKLAYLGKTGRVVMHKLVKTGVQNVDLLASFHCHILAGRTPTRSERVRQLDTSPGVCIRELHAGSITWPPESQLFIEVMATADNELLL